MRRKKILALQPDEAVLLQLGRMVPRKGVDNVVKAIGKSGKRGKESKAADCGR
jgi:D-inositol-3-phosphate glycosyltransferase